MRIRVCWYKNAGVAGYAEAFRPVQSDSQTSEWYSYFENDVLDTEYVTEDIAQPSDLMIQQYLIFIAILVNNAFKTVQQSAKDKEDICRRADARQRYLTQDFTL